MANPRMITVRVLLFAGARSAAGVDHLSLSVPAGVSLADLRQELSSQYGALEPLLAHSRFAVGADFIGESATFDQSTEIAWIPPVSGG